MVPSSEVGLGRFRLSESIRRLDQPDHVLLSLRRVAGAARFRAEELPWWTEGSPRQLLCAGGCLAEPVPGQLGSRHRQTRASASRLLGSSRTGVSSCKRSSLARNLPGRGQSNSTVKPY